MTPFICMDRVESINNALSAFCKSFLLIVVLPTGKVVRPITKIF